jgi:hypothetical protein
MKKKAFRFNTSSKQAKEKRQEIVVSSKGGEKLAVLKARRALVILCLLIMTTFGVAMVSNWRSNQLPLAAAMPQGTPPVMPASAPGREYIYAGSALISTVEPFRETPDDLAVWRTDASSGKWYFQSSGTNQSWGLPGDVPKPGDYDGDGKADLCIFRPSTNTWWILRSSDGVTVEAPFGASGDKLVPADYDGDGKTDIAVWRPSDYNWYIKLSSTGSMTVASFGTAGDKPVPADYDGDGKTDLAIWRDTISAPEFWVFRSSNYQAFAFQMGLAGDEPVIGDYDGDGKSDFALRRPSTNYWYINHSSTGSTGSVQWGLTSDIAVPGRYISSLDNDTKTDIAVWRPSSGSWYIIRSSDGGWYGVQFGLNGDIPVPANWRR